MYGKKRYNNTYTLSTEKSSDIELKFSPDLARPKIKFSTIYSQHLTSFSTIYGVHKEKYNTILCFFLDSLYVIWYRTAKHILSIFYFRLNE